MELKSQINKAEQEKDIKTLEEIQENAEIGFEGEIAGLAKAALDRLHGKVEDAEKTPDHVVEKLGEEKVEEITAEVDKEIEVLKENTEDQIEAVVENSLEQETNNEKIKHLQEQIEKEYEKLRAIDTKKGDHIKELEDMMATKGYIKEIESIKGSLDFNNKQIEKELFRNKEKTVNYLQRIFTNGPDINDRTKRELQDLIDNFDNKKSDFEFGRDTIGGMAWKSIQDHSEKLGNTEISSLTSTKVILQSKMNELNTKIDSDADLVEIKQRHELYNQLNQPELEDIKIRNNITNLKKEIENLQIN